MEEEVDLTCTLNGKDVTPVTGDKLIKDQILDVYENEVEPELAKGNSINISPALAVYLHLFNKLNMKYKGEEKGEHIWDIFFLDYPEVEVVVDTK